MKVDDRRIPQEPATAANQPAQPAAEEPAAPPAPPTPNAPPTTQAAEAGAPQGEEATKEISQEDAQRYKAIVDSLEQSLRENPDFEEVLSLLVRGEGMGFLEAVATVVSPEELQAAVDAAADGTVFAKRVSDRKAKKEQAATLEKNIQESVNAIAQYCRQAGYSEEQEAALADSAVQWFQVWADGKITVDEVEKLDKMLSYDSDVAASYEDGQSAGKAQRASAIKADKNAEAVTAGIGRVGVGAGESVKKPKNKEYNENDLLERAAYRIKMGMY